MTRPPAGYVHARDAINAVGRSLFPGEWTGDESDRKHRSLLPPGFPIRSNAFEPIPVRRDAPRVGPGEDTRETHVVTFAPDTPEYRERFKAAQEAQKRWAQALDTILDRIESGAARVCVVDPSTGYAHPLSSYWARRIGANEILYKGRARLPHSENTGNLFLSESVVPPSNAASTTTAESDCQKWFEGLMVKSPRGDNVSREERAKQAREKFPRITGEGVKRARARAIERTSAIDWKKAGPKSKS